jgi:hypothetical protein
MNFNIIKRYLILADEEKIDRHDCPEEPEHGRLYANLTDDDKIFLYCLSCKYKIFPGYNSLKDMELKVIEHDVESDLRHIAGLE